MDRSTAKCWITEDRWVTFCRAQSFAQQRGKRRCWIWDICQNYKLYLSKLQNVFVKIQFAQRGKSWIWKMKEMSFPSIILPIDHHPAWCIMLVFESLDFMLKMLKIIYSQCSVWTFLILVNAQIRYGWFNVMKKHAKS